AHPHPRSAINAYLLAVHVEATRRGYAFDRCKISPVRMVEPILVSSGQLACEWRHLQSKLSARSPGVLAQWSALVAPEPHPLFLQQPGPVATWERASVTLESSKPTPRRNAASPRFRKVPTKD